MDHPNEGGEEAARPHRPRDQRPEWIRRYTDWMPEHARKIVVGVIGFTIILIGVGMLVFPGPGWVVIFAGFALLATEFVWARRLLKRAKRAGKGGVSWFSQKFPSTSAWMTRQWNAVVVWFRRTFQSRSAPDGSPAAPAQDASRPPCASPCGGDPSTQDFSCHSRQTSASASTPRGSEMPPQI